MYCVKTSKHDSVARLSDFQNGILEDIFINICII